MRNIKLSETEWNYIKEALVHSDDFVDSWGYKSFSKEWNRKLKILNRAEYKVFNAKKGN